MKLRILRLCKKTFFNNVGIVFIILVICYFIMKDGAHFIKTLRKLPELPSKAKAKVIEQLTRPFTPMMMTNSDLEQIYQCDLQPSDGQKLLVANRSLPFCSCIPEGLQSFIPFKKMKHETLSYARLYAKHSSVRMGEWSPPDCISRHKIVVIVPYRDREDHLLQFLDVIHSYLQKQKITYTLIVAEQGSPQMFNKAKLMNAAYSETRKHYRFDCIIFHDIDLIPEDERNVYTCTDAVRHQGVGIDVFDYKCVSAGFIGGVSVFNQRVFEEVDGYSNKFWGWGGEDDNMWYRVLERNITLHRPPYDLARYHMFTHDRDEHNPINTKRLTMMNSTIHNDGLSTLKYSLLHLRRKPLYVWMLVDISD